MGIRLTIQPLDPTLGTVPRSPDKVKCKAATPAEKSAIEPPRVLFMALEGL